MAALFLGIVAILGLVGVLGYLPNQASFFVSALAIALFPGAAFTSIAGRSSRERNDLLEKLIMWFVVGTGFLMVAGFAGILFQVRLGQLTMALALGYAALLLLVVALRRRAGQPAITPEPTAHSRASIGVISGLLVTAVGLALITLLTPRDFDDWFYLAYIRSFVANAPLGGEDALFNMGNPASPRIWFGGAWWVLEAILSKASAVDPVECHQVYMPVLLLPFAVLALFALCRSVFRSVPAALLATSLHLLFYLSSAFPQKSVGWFFLCRIAQDKAVSFFVIAAYAAALGLWWFRRKTDRDSGNLKILFGLYCLAVLGSFLAHGMGPVWCGLLIIPAGLLDVLFKRDRTTLRRLAVLTLPIIVCWLVLAFARRFMGEFLSSPGPDPIHISEAVHGLYLPGDRFGNLIETRNPIVWMIREGVTILNPLFVTRFPFAIAGVALTILLIPRLRSSFAARFALGVTITSLILAYTPVGASIASALMGSKLLFRLSWPLLWGPVAAVFLARLRLRPVFTWIIVAAIALGLARGDPGNYVRGLASIRPRNRPIPEAVDVLERLGSEPSPQGRVFASDAVSRMISGYLTDATPVTFREEGPIGREEADDMEHKWRDRRAFFKSLRELNIGYVILERESYLNRNLAQRVPTFALIHENASYNLWRVTADIDSIPLRELVR